MYGLFGSKTRTWLLFTPVDVIGSHFVPKTVENMTFRILYQICHMKPLYHEFSCVCESFNIIQTLQVAYSSGAHWLRAISVPLGMAGTQLRATFYVETSALCMLISFQIWMKFEEINRILLQFYLLRTSSFWGLRPQTPALYFRESKLNQFRVKYRRILWTKKSASIVILFVILFLGAAPPRSLLFISGNQILTNFVSNTDEIYKQINRIPL